MVRLAVIGDIRVRQCALVRAFVCVESVSIVALFAFIDDRVAENRLPAVALASVTVRGVDVIALLSADFIPNTVPADEARLEFALIRAPVANIQIAVVTLLAVVEDSVRAAWD